MDATPYACVPQLLSPLKELLFDMCAYLSSSHKYIFSSTSRMLNSSSPGTSPHNSVVFCAVYSTLTLLSYLPAGLLHPCHVCSHSLQTAGWAGGALVSLQLDTAALCKALGARAEAERLASAALQASSADAEALGLREMLADMQPRRSISMPAAAAHAAALRATAKCLLRRQKLASAERCAREAR